MSIRGSYNILLFFTTQRQKHNTTRALTTQPMSNPIVKQAAFFAVGSFQSVFYLSRVVYRFRPFIHRVADYLMI